LVIDGVKMLKGLEIKSNTAIKSKDSKGTIHFFIDPYTPAQNEKWWWAEFYETYTQSSL
jgi:hypothetical protein